MAVPIVFFDRGIPDVLAYMDYFDQEYGPEFIDALESHRYDSIFLLPMWQEIYTSDSERFESYEDGFGNSSAAASNLYPIWLSCC